MTQQFAVITG